jgi:uncharacterized protein YndB with AHSA1/START domain
MIDIVSQINETHRELGNRRIPAGEGRAVLLRRSYDAPIEDVWSACTDPDRIKRWFMPITGDLRVGGTYQLEGNAGGEILRCEPPRLLKVTWVYGDDPKEADISEVEVWLSPGTDGETVLELEHAAVVDPERWATFGPGAVGVGWDLALLGLGLHLRGGSIEDPDAWGQSPEAREFMTRSSKAWGAAHEAAGATPAEAATAAENTSKFYAPDPDSTGTEGETS